MVATTARGMAWDAGSGGGAAIAVGTTGKGDFRQKGIERGGIGEV